MLPTGIELAGNHLLFTKIFLKFAKTEYGKTLRSTIRFSEFIPEGMSYEDWQKTLGGDVNNLYHLSVSLENTKYFLLLCANPSQKWQKELPQDAIFTSEEQISLLFTSVVHDWAEAIIGDIPLTSKKESDENQEMIVLRKLLHKILGNENERQKIEQLANTVEVILTDKSTKLGKAFNAIEKIGYLKTGMKAWYVAANTDGELKKRLKHLATRVVAVHASKLIDYADIYPAVHAYLHYRRKAISDIFTQTEKKDQEVYEKWLAFITAKIQMRLRK